ncbi:NUDIX domain-containing protein [Phenylobacterium montanum]|uniref:GDP-mannose pyrophosphatase n=1 Tax=Phenylobacterium montanum TaxID=2823693 RepID=A0A975FVM3_9CAUL|nr:NUDIX domain-containing protein [Caulobacter sp. S6]QUD86140.1 NUDIX domain-containing protein [Caulobacter sp. S6]
MRVADRVKVHEVKLLSDNWYVLRKATFSWLRRDGTWQEQSRESYDRGNGAVILLYDPDRRTVLLTRQFRYPAFANGYDDLLIEAPAGLLDDASPEERIRAETEEETGYRVRDVRPVFEAFMSPGSVTEKLHFFVGRYSPADRIGEGGGEESEGEDIETLEVGLDRALAMIASGEICDAKTIMLLQYAALNGLMRPPPPA